MYCRSYVLINLSPASVYTPVVCGICISQYGFRRKTFFVLDVVFFVYFIVSLYFCYEIIFIVFSSQTFEYFSIIYIL